MAQEPAQDRIDKAAPVPPNCASKDSGQVDRFVDCSRLGDTIEKEELIGAKPEQHLYDNRKAGKWLVQNRLKSPVDGRKPPQDAIGELHRESPFPTVERASRKDTIQQNIDPLLTLNRLHQQRKGDRTG